MSSSSSDFSELKSRFPFRLGAPSYVYRADILTNVVMLAPLVDDVELVLFEAERPRDLPSQQVTGELRALAKEYGLTYTVHLPLDLKLAGMEDLRDRALKKARWVIEATKSLDPWAYVVHLDGTEIRSVPSSLDLAGWWKDAARSLEIMAEEIGNPRLLAVENLDSYSPTMLLPLLERLPISLCVDIGHFLKNGKNPLPFLKENLDRTRVVHIHGSRTGQDHRGLDQTDHGLVGDIVSLLLSDGYQGVLTLEVFSKREFFISRNIIYQLMEVH